ncbi:MAG: putative ABC transport system ATP-binding protein [Chloroflexi bacterium]|nr:MAG: putative ABC transport system ATP-binding protein [Chloroflexota bacterium]
MGSVEVRALQDVSLAVEQGEMMALVGRSGSGKSTMMNILGCLDIPTAGSYLLDGEEVTHLKDDRLAEIRNRKVGFVFQTYNLLPRLTAIANVELPLLYGNGRQGRKRSMAALDRVGLAHRARHRPVELSGGEQQRVGIARALVKQPALLLADEPTGNLDSGASASIMGTLQRLNRDEGITIIVVTHERDIAAHTRRIVTLSDGAIITDEPVLSPLDATEAERLGEDGS